MVEKRISIVYYLISIHVYIYLLFLFRNTFIICCLFSFLACICLGVLTLTFHEGSNDKTLLLFVYFVTTCFVFLSVIVNGVFSYFIQELQQMYPPVCNII